MLIVWRGGQGAGIQSTRQRIGILSPRRISSILIKACAWCLYLLPETRARIRLTYQFEIRADLGLQSGGILNSKDHTLARRDGFLRRLVGWKHLRQRWLRCQFHRH
jgi:hypothetical protein